MTSKARPLWSNEEDAIVLAGMQQGLTYHDIHKALVDAGFSRSIEAIGNRRNVLRKQLQQEAQNRDKDLLRFSISGRW